jgi:hypothetical protein
LLKCQPVREPSLLGNNDRYIVNKLFDGKNSFHQDFFDKMPVDYLENLRWTFNQLNLDHIRFVETWNSSVNLTLAD